MAIFIFFLVSGLIAWFLWPEKAKGKPLIKKPVDDNSTSTEAEDKAGIQTQKRQYELMTESSIVPHGQALTSAQAAKIFKLFMIGIGYLEKQELADHTRYFKEDMKRFGDDLSDAVVHEKQNLYGGEASDCKNDIRKLNRQLEKERSEVKSKAIEKEISELQTELYEEEHYLRQAEAALQEFRVDKRKFTIEYINNKTQR